VAFLTSNDETNLGQKCPTASRCLAIFCRRMAKPWKWLEMFAKYLDCK
jgi:hypothetical protein